MASDDLDVIRRHMAQKLNLFRCADCLAKELPRLGKERVDAVFAHLDGERRPDLVLFFEDGVCDVCGRAADVVIVH